MKTSCCLGCALLLALNLSGIAQTNSLPPESSHLSPAQLPPAGPALELPAPEVTPILNVSSNAVDKEMTANSGVLTGDVHGEGTREAHFYLDQRSEAKPANLLSKIGEPEVVYFGKKQLTCSAITAVKRKNPLCLINANFLNLNW